MLRHRMFCEHSIEIIKVVCFLFSLPGASPDRNAAQFTRETDIRIQKSVGTHHSANELQSYRLFSE